MKPAPFKYYRATNFTEAASLIGELENARLLAGGQSLMPMMNMRYVMVDHLIDLNEISDMSGIQIDGNHVRIGAMTRQRDIFASETLSDKAPIFAQTLQQVGRLAAMFARKWALCRTVFRRRIYRADGS